MATPDDKLIRLLSDAHERTGDGRYRRALNAIRGIRPGRKVIDDSEAIEHAQSLLNAGLADTEHEACAKVAMFAGMQRTRAESVRDRLRRKIRKSRTI